VGLKKDLVPTLGELKRMIDAADIEGKFTIILLAQTGMRPEDAINLKVGDVKRELDLGNCPMAITFLPEKDRNRGIGERITFLGKDGIDILKQYLDWRKRSGENITADSPLLIGRSKMYNAHKVTKLTVQMLNMRVVEAARKAGVGNDNGKYGRVRAYCLRKFFITQLTNHGVSDKIVNFLTCHMIGEVDRVYWFRRVDELREIYRQREKYLNPISETQSKPSPEEIEQKIESKIKEFMRSEEFKQAIYEALNGNNRYESKIVNTKEELIELSNRGFECQVIGPNKWLMRRHVK
jgi:integrase